MLNVLLLSDLKCIVDRDDISEMDYMSHFIFSLASPHFFSHCHFFAAVYGKSTHGKHNHTYKAHDGLYSFSISRKFL